MRRLQLVLLAVIIVFLLQGNSKPTIDGVLLKNSVVFKTMKLESSDTLKNIIILPNSTKYNPNEVTNIILRLDHLPTSILQKVALSGIKVKLFQGKLTDNPSASYLKGITPRGYSNHAITWDDIPGVGGSKIVLVKIGYSEKGKGHGSINLELHELAHSLDKYLFHAENKNGNYLSIWKEEAQKLFPNQNYLMKYPEEYFAESFAMYYYTNDSKKQLKYYAPKTYAYISSLK